MVDRAEKRRQKKLAMKAAKSRGRVNSNNLAPAQRHAASIHQAIDQAAHDYSAGNLPNAERICRQILQTDPNHPIALHLLGVISHQVGNYITAAQLIRKALSVSPGDAELHMNLGITLQELGELNDAIANFRAALAIVPNHAGAYNNLGIALQELGMLDEAIASYRQILIIEPENAGAHNNLGIAQQELGRLDEAAVNYRKALAIEPDYTEAYRHLSSIHRYTAYDNEIETMEKIYQATDKTGEQRMHMAFALGKVFEDLKQFETAFQYFATGNTIKRQIIKYDTNDTQRYFEGLKTQFTKAFLSQNKTEEIYDLTPVFIVGMPRSGTTLVEQILASHPLVYGAGELYDFSNIIRRNFGRVDSKKFPELVFTASDDNFRDVAQEYINALRNHSRDHLYITDKMPQNFELIGMIKLVLPNAKIIHCRRNPMDTCLSIFKNYFSSGAHNYAYDLKELGAYYKLYEDLMTHWRKVLPGFIHEIEYEEIVSDQRNQTEALLEYCGLKWDNACIDFDKTERRVKTASSVQVRRPLYTDSIQSWKRYETQLAPMVPLVSALEKTN